MKLPTGYHLDWAGEYESQKSVLEAPDDRPPHHPPRDFHHPLHHVSDLANGRSSFSRNVAMAPLGGLLALLLTGTHFSVSSGVGFLALFGVSVQTGVIMLEYINQLRVRGHSIEDPPSKAPSCACAPS